jgi:glycosyltransferase involved in cell wall biosynthesis
MSVSRFLPEVAPARRPKHVMALITVGVPAYNEAELLAGSLESLRVQSFRDFEVLVFDNASTDDTPRVIADFAARDPRFRHIRQPYNKGFLRNHHESLLSAKSPYFLWRACDDRSDPNYLEALFGLLQDHPNKDVAVGNIITSKLDGSNARQWIFPNYVGGPTFLNRVRHILGLRPGWIYGLYRREALVTRVQEIMEFDDDAWDILVLLAFLIDDRIVGTRGTTFHQFSKRIKTPGRPKHKRTDAELDTLIDRRRRYFAAARDTLAARVTSWPMRRVYDLVLWLHTGKRLFRFRKVIWRLMTRPRDHKYQSL